MEMEDFGKILEERGFFKSWVRMLKKRRDPFALAGLVLDRLSRDDDKVRGAYWEFAGFIDCRPWKEVKAFILSKIPEADRSVFEAESAPKFYLGFRKVVVTSISNHYKRIEPETKLDIPDAAKEQIQAIENNLKTFLIQEVERQIKDMYKHLTDFFRKELREDWKGDDWGLGNGNVDTKEDEEGKKKKRPMDDEGFEG